jgi:hypothetical protein
MEDPKYAAWLAAFGNDFCFQESVKYFNVFSRRIAYTTCCWANRCEWEKVLTTLRLGCCDANDRVYFPERVLQASLLQVATSNADLSTMRALVHEFGARLDACDSNKHTVLMYAVFVRSLEKVQWLLQFPDIVIFGVDKEGRAAYNYTMLAGDYHIGAAIAARVRWSSRRAAWLAACVRA